jgi:hypothetical protein
VGHRKAATPIGTLDTHPNAEEIRGILSRLPCITDSELSALAAAWHNTTLLAEARRRALEPDSPLVVEVLSWFDRLQELFVDELRGEADYVEIEPEVASTALKAVRDAIAAAYDHPILTAGEHAALMKAWRSVYATDHLVEAAEAQLRHDFPDFLGNEAHEVNDIFRFAAEALAQFGFLRGHTHGARIQVTHPHHDTAHRHEWCGGKTKFFSPEQRGDNDIAAGF